MGLEQVTEEQFNNHIWWDSDETHEDPCGYATCVEVFYKDGEPEVLAV